MLKKKELDYDNNTKIRFYSLGFVTPIILFGIYYINKKL